MVIIRLERPQFDLFYFRSVNRRTKKNEEKQQKISLFLQLTATQCIFSGNTLWWKHKFINSDLCWILCISFWLAVLYSVRIATERLILSFQPWYGTEFVCKNDEIMFDLNQIHLFRIFVTFFFPLGFFC